jgi:SAM-dependent methyltransferase
MGLARPALRFLAREHARRPFVGPVLTLGRQHVYATPEEARALIRAERLVPAPLAPEDETRSNIPEWRGTAHESHLSDVAFFRLLGVAEVHALDCSDFEGATIVHDLNVPVPAALWSRFDLIVDGGTLEHVFDVRQSLTNIGRMLTPGGRVVHVSPANNWVNHGFYQFSPTLFYDFYAANGFVDLRGYLAEHDPYRLTSHPWEFFEVGVEGRLGSRWGLMTVFVAQKTAQSTADRIPQQSHYARVHARGGGAEPPRVCGGFRALIRRVKARRPEGAKALLRRIIPGYERRKLLGRLKRWGRL